jgi:hypothetical protein
LGSPSKEDDKRGEASGFFASGGWRYSSVVSAISRRITPERNHLILCELKSGGVFFHTLKAVFLAWIEARMACDGIYENLTDDVLVANLTSSQCHRCSLLSDNTP